MRRRWRRRNYFIKKDLQGKYIFSFFIFALLGCITFALIFGLLSFDKLTIIYQDHYLQIGKTPLILLKEILRAYWIFIFTAGLTIAVFSMFLTHRFAGPIYRFERALEEMIKGNFSFVIRLRKKDENKQIAAMLNELINTLSSNLKEMRDLADEIGNSLETAKTEISRGKGGEEATRLLDEATALSTKLKGLLYQFKIKNEE